MKLSKLNKVLIGVLLLMTVFLVQQKVTEQKRVEYYVCYYQMASMVSIPDEERINEYCKNEEQEMSQWIN